MADMLQVAHREIKMGFRNPWAYSFLALLCTFSLGLLLINSQNVVQGYSAVTGSMLSLILYLLPLMTLFLGSFSLTSEKEEGSWQLLSTYPIGTMSFILGKYTGLAVVLLIIVATGYGLMGMISGLIGMAFDSATYFLLLAFSAGLVLLFLTVALFIGSLSRNRWQALTVSVSVWFFTIIGWPTFLIAILGLMPYLWIKPLLVALTILNPAELVRLFVVIKLGGGSVLGPEYYQWVEWIGRSTGSLLFMLVCLAWILISILAVYRIWERGRSRG
ncbi:ABC transporter permease [Paenibacillus macquariensis]|uniref:Cu-processing system permease protein n=1 Tax=Paenibacillus macquariensis TaxID=948756 RepID=A0ABY1JQ99_9BACL|nr:ABC transporter permease subunit [Paenibacillus macquariensis]MEC0094091.1 ABC transporter permease subunit [Paenibacillus macquariensis]OAB37550.1 ABC transporter permease [Paenibacillus macquariensis subsp. macquariensis]SIQ56150.1 Cu-processing system permease protein [Paenibacillus macquariensis]